MPDKTEDIEDKTQQPENKPLRPMRAITAAMPKGVALPSILKRFQRTKQYGATPVTRQRVIAKGNQEKFKDFGLQIKQKNTQNLRNLNLSAGKKKSSWDKADMVLPNGEPSTGQDNSDLDSLRQLLNSMPSQQPSQIKTAGKTDPVPVKPKTPAPSRTAPKEVSTPRWKKPETGARRFSKVEEVVSGRPDTGQTPDPQAGIQAVPLQKPAGRPVIQRQVQEIAIPEIKPRTEKEKTWTERPLESEQQKSSLGDRPAAHPTEPSVRQPKSQTPAARDLTLTRPPAQQPKEEPRPEEIRREPLKDTSPAGKPLQEKTSAVKPAQKIKKTGSIDKKTAAPDHKTPPEFRSTAKEQPSGQSPKTSGSEPARGSLLRKINLASQKKRRADSAVQRILSESDKKNPAFYRSVKTGSSVCTGKEDFGQTSGNPCGRSGS